MAFWLNTLQAKGNIFLFSSYFALTKIYQNSEQHHWWEI